MQPENVYLSLAAAYVRGCGAVPVPDGLSRPALADLTEPEMAQLLALGEAAGLKMYRFKKTALLPRVRAVLGILKGIYPERLLDVGSGRGVFLFPFLTEFPEVEVTSLDLLDHRVALLQGLSAGGVAKLKAQKADLCTWPGPEKDFDVVTALEVLEHIPQVEAAVKAVVRLARRYVVVTVPSKPDNNPEHIHLLTKDRLTALFEAAGCRKLRFGGVPGHLVLTAKID